MAKLEGFLRTAKQRLKEAGIPSYALDADLLLSKALNQSREFVIGHPEHILSTIEELAFSRLLERRLQREPMAHILGKREFWGNDFIVTSETLAPRPDSETLIETALKHFPDKNQSLKILDLGTGTGCLIITLLLEYKNAIGVAIEAGQETIKIAKKNADILEVADRLTFQNCRWEEAKLNNRFDLIISNPPYVPTVDIPTLEPEVYHYEPHQALFAGEDGLDCYRSLIPLLPVILEKKGKVILEHGIGQEGAISSIAEQHGLHTIEYCKDLAGINRCILLGL